MTQPRLVVDGRLTVPLFHGTSTLFYESILETGLGGRNLLQDLGLPQVIRHILTYDEEQLQKVPNWDFEKTFLPRISEPEKNPIGSFLRYCGTYVTPSKHSAVRYALLNKCGSEALTTTLKILDALFTHFPHLANEEQFSTVLAFANKPRKPILIEACDVQEDLLLSERGEDCGPVLEFIESEMTDPEMYDIMVQQSNFELRCPIPPSQLRFYKIVSPQSGYDSLEDIHLEPLSNDSPKLGELPKKQRLPFSTAFIVTSVLPSTASSSDHRVSRAARVL